MGTIEDMMMNEAIRRSLAEASPQPTVEASQEPPAISLSIQRNTTRHIDDIESVYNEMR